MTILPCSVVVIGPSIGMAPSRNLQCSAGQRRRLGALYAAYKHVTYNVAMQLHDHSATTSRHIERVGDVNAVVDAQMSSR
jgi:hypothetical protein